VAIGIALRSGKREVVAGTRQGDEEEAFFFLAVIGRAREHSIGRRTALAAPLQWEDAVPERWKMHGRKLQSLAGVHSHEPHRVDCFDGCRRLAQRALVAKHLQPPNPAEQTTLRVAIGRTIVFDRELEKLMDGEATLVVGGCVAGQIVTDKAALEKHVAQKLPWARLEANAIEIGAQLRKGASACRRKAV
jgi:hypothetical protein